MERHREREIEKKQSQKSVSGGLGWEVESKKKKKNGVPGEQFMSGFDELSFFLPLSNIQRFGFGIGFFVHSKFS